MVDVFVSDPKRPAFFFDSYALLELFDANPAYERFANVSPVLCVFNVYETYYAFLRRGAQAAADAFVAKWSPYAHEVNALDAQEAARFRFSNSAKGFSMADAFGYVIAQRLAIPFLTGDPAFQGLPGVEFVR